MCTSMPKVHVAISGMEKVIPSVEDLSVFLRLLIRSATGQMLSSYVTTVTGPRREYEEDGPEEFHLVIVDNGRSRLLADPDLREALYCLRCGACLNACPVYRKVGGHAYGWVYPGPIGAIVSPMLTGLSDAKDLPYASTLCGACKEACPVQIDIPRMLLYLRKELTQGDNYPDQRSASPAEAAAMKGWRASVSSDTAMRAANLLARLGQSALSKDGNMSNLPGPLSGVDRTSRFPARDQTIQIPMARHGRKMSQRDDFLANIRGALGRRPARFDPAAAAPHSAGPPDELGQRVQETLQLISRDADNLMSVLARVAETSRLERRPGPRCAVSRRLHPRSRQRDRGSLARLFAPLRSPFRLAPRLSGARPEYRPPRSLWDTSPKTKTPRTAPHSEQSWKRPTSA